MNVHLFWDNSNIWLVGKNVCKAQEPGDELGFRIHFANLFDFAIAKRPVEYAFVGGSIPPTNDLLWKRFDNLGIKVETQERGQYSGGEVAVDEEIQLAMANQTLDAAPGVMILLTGDGSGYNEGRGFIKQLERAHKHGWKIEVVSWDSGCNRFLREYAKQNGVYRPLETAYDKVTFINNKRWAAGT